ncbi:Fur family transcriptional regulator [Streptacidiphilus neutrinimicus]|uniref:Fur family transcriptional regulator n=1 Tax=Streptacidiphilus neutrinimicus TaxID=105420 RepID=UPI000A46226F|nr:Fur family transcriptional regulator [Streptacidiphilus neutrinimicus]
MTSTDTTSAPGEVALLGRPTQQRATVLRALIDSEDFVSAQVLHARLIAAGNRVGLSTIYRTLTALAEAGLADTMRDSEGERHFRHRPGPDHRHYLRCRTCGRSVAVDSHLVERWAERIGATSGFTEISHTVELTGICADCTGPTAPAA